MVVFRSWRLGSLTSMTSGSACSAFFISVHWVYLGLVIQQLSWSLKPFLSYKKLSSDYDFCPFMAIRATILVTGLQETTAY